MTVLDKRDQSFLSRKDGGEIRLNSRAVSRGVAIGKIICLYGQNRQFYRTNLDESKIEREIKRFQAAVNSTKKQIAQMSSRNNELTKDVKANIFDFHLLLLEDKSLVSKIETKIRDGRVNAEWAVKTILDGYISSYKNISDEHLRDRYIDLHDVSDRLLNALGGKKINTQLKENSIIVAEEVKPSTIIELIDSQPRAIIAENGGWTSHAFILARELNLPAVTGAKNILRRVRNGDDVIVDGYNGQIILHPSKETLKEFRVAAANFQKINAETLGSVGGDLKTLDGREITIRANLDLPTDYRKAENLGARGVGLYRSEFLFNQYEGFPSEEEQLAAYLKIGKMVGKSGVLIRTFDLSINQLNEEEFLKEKNPALGLRGIRMSLSHRKEFRTQLRALLQASAEYKIDIILPLISDVAEILKTKEIIRREKSFLKKRNLKYGNPKIGAMIEVPSAVLTVEEIAAEVDFLSLGTNDLVQYLLAVDRDNETVSDWFKTLHPAVLRSIEKVIKEAENRSIPLIVCGEMAGSPFYTPILIGLGARELSMNINSIARVRRTISGIAFEEAQELAENTKKCRTSAEIEELVRTSFNEKWSHLFSSEIVPIK